jgi:hypothetical protein
MALDLYMPTWLHGTARQNGTARTTPYAVGSPSESQRTCILLTVRVSYSDLRMGTMGYIDSTLISRLSHRDTQVGRRAETVGQNHVDGRDSLQCHSSGG